MSQERQTEVLDISERGRAATGEVIRSDRRLFMQLLVYTGCRDTARLAAALASAPPSAPMPAHVTGVLYEDINDPFGIGLLSISEEPDFFVTTLRHLLVQPPFADLTPRPELTMFGRTYALGYEPDLEETLVDRPLRKLADPAMPWAIWYPLRRSGSFEQLSAEEQRVILMEHGGIGHAYGRAGYGTDIRLACHGLDAHDNDFVVGLLGPELYPLSSIVQRMRKTKQTSLHLERLGPFFIGKAAWQSPVVAP